MRKVPWFDWRPFALVIVSALIGTLLSEAAYRAWLIYEARDMQPKMPDLLHIYWPGQFTYRPYGYDYGPPGGETTQVELRRNPSQPYGYAITGVSPARYPEYGNFPPIFSAHRTKGYQDVDYDKADLKILAFGDSFTAGSWPDILQYKLEQSTGKRVRVLNFGRDFFGILQMLDIAAYYTPRLKPDLILIGFITEDLARPRTWRGVKRTWGYDRLVISSVEDPDEFNDTLNVLGDAALVNPLAQQLRKQVERTGKLPPNDDPRIGKLVKQAETFARMALPPAKAGVFDLGSSVLWRQIVHGSPVPPTVPFPVLKLNDFREDERAVRAVGVLHATKVPIVLIHIPILTVESPSKPVVFGRLTHPDQDRKLFESIEPMIGEPIFKIAPVLPPDLDVGKYIQSPTNAHPNQAGAELYAEIIAKHLMARHLVDKPVE